MDDIFTQLAEDYGLELILQQNDLEPRDVLEILWDKGLLDLEDYIFTELSVEDED
jgi:hypothetical protein